MRVVSGAWRANTGWDPSPAEFAAGSVDGGARTLLMFFADRDLGAHPVHDLEAALPTAATVGCSTAGQILGDELTDAPMVAVAVHFDNVTPRAAWASLAEAGTSIEVGELVAQRLALAPSPRSTGTVFVLSDGSLVNGTALVDGLRSVVPAEIGISGGLAGDSDHFEQTWVYADGEARTGAVAAVALLGSSLRIGYGSEGGWDGFGPYRQVTAAKGNVLHSLDDRPALSLYQEHLGEQAAGLPASALNFPLLITSPDGSVELVRTILSVDDENSTMTFAGDVPVGWSARLMRTTADQLVEAAAVAAEATSHVVGDGDDMRDSSNLTLAVSCVGRRLVLGQRVDEEVEAVAEVIGSSGTLIGFYSYGEITQKGVFCDLHNQTMTLTTLSEG